MAAAVSAVPLASLGVVAFQVNDSRRIRRHTLHVSDKELMLLDRAVQAYAQVIRIHAPVDARTEAHDTARVSSVIQIHRNCTCAVPEEGS